MGADTIVLIGTPGTGKTNFLGRMWEALRSNQGCLVCPVPPDQIKYLEDALEFILSGEFAPRSNPTISESRSDVRLAVQIKDSPQDQPTEILVPDVTGELWKHAIESFEIPHDWLQDLQGASGAMLFVRVHSPEIVAPLDWINARKILRNPLFKMPEEKSGIPTQVQLSELLRFLELSLIPHQDGSPPRVAVLLTAFDRLDTDTKNRGVAKYLRQEYPIFASKIERTTMLDMKVFGTSIVGGDLKDDKDFQEEFLAGDISQFGYVVTDEGESTVLVKDISIPLMWLVKGD